MQITSPPRFGAVYAIRGEYYTSPHSAPWEKRDYLKPIATQVYAEGTAKNVPVHVRIEEAFTAPGRPFPLLQGLVVYTHEDAQRIERALPWPVSVARRQEIDSQYQLSPADQKKFDKLSARAERDTPAIMDTKKGNFSWRGVWGIVRTWVPIILYTSLFARRELNLPRDHYGRMLKATPLTTENALGATGKLTFDISTGNPN